MDDSLQQGIIAFKSRELETARALFSTAVKQNPDSERAWGWFYNVCNTNEERIECLQNIVRLNPQNEKASQILDELMEADFPLELPFSQPATAAMHKPNTPQSEQSKIPAINNSSLGLDLLFSFLLLVAIYGSTFLIASNWNGNSVELRNMLAIYQMGVGLGITFLAIRGLNPRKRGFIQYAGIYILGLIPIVGWFVIYWAGKGLSQYFINQNANYERESSKTPNERVTFEPVSKKQKLSYTEGAQFSPKIQSPAWHSGVIWAFIVTLLYFLGQIIKVLTSARPFLEVMIEIIVGFFIHWAIASLFISLWRKNSGFGRLLGCVAVYGLIVVLGIISYSVQTPIKIAPNNNSSNAYIVPSDDLETYGTGIQGWFNRLDSNITGPAYKKNDDGTYSPISPIWYQYFFRTVWEIFRVIWDIFKLGNIFILSR